MDKVIKTKLKNILMAECRYNMKHTLDITTRYKNMETLFNLKKIIDNYDDLEPVLKDYFSKKADRERFER